MYNKKKAGVVFTVVMVVSVLRMAAMSTVASETSNPEVSEGTTDTNLLKLDENLREMVRSGDVNKTVSVIVVLVEQPTHDVSEEVKAEYKPQLENITAPAKAIRKRIKPLLGPVEELRSKNISEVIAMEQALMTEEEKQVLKETPIKLERKLSQMRKEILARAEPLLNKTQAPVIEKMEANGCEIGYRGKIFNLIIADVPVSYLEELSKEPSIAVIWSEQLTCNEEMKMERLKRGK